MTTAAGHANDKGLFKPRDREPDAWDDDFEIEPEPDPEYGDFWPELDDDDEP